MRPRSRALVLTALLAATTIGHGAASPKAGADGPAAELARLADDWWDHWLRVSPALRIPRGLPVDALPDVSFEAERKNADFARGILERLARIDRAALAGEDLLTWEILEWEAGNTSRAAEHAPLLFQVTPYTWSFLGVDRIFATQRFERPEDLGRYLALLSQLPPLVDRLRGNLELQRARGIVLPQAAVGPVVALFRAAVRPPEEGPYHVADERLAAVGGPESTEVRAFRAEARAIVAKRVNPAYEALVAYLEGPYRAAAPERVGLGQYPGGEAAYRFLVRVSTTLDSTPEEIHRRGLAEVARLDARMAELRQRLGLAGTAAEAHARLRADPRFLAKTPEEVGSRLMTPLARLEPKLPAFFGRLPRAPYGVARLDPRLEGAMTFGYYQEPTPGEPRGLYMYNGSRLEERPLVGAAALIAHELVPGHHFQIALQRENRALPAFRREGGHSAFVEGWAEYASDLAGEMGLYEDPWDLYGRLGMDMFLSTRLVVDTGMHALGWSRERAAGFMRDHALESPTQIETETLRYAADLPAQALAYKTGSATFHELRARAERELGARFDPRRFHDRVLGSGSMPLAVLERHVDRWIAEEKRRQAPDGNPN